MINYFEIIVDWRKKVKNYFQPESLLKELIFKKSSTYCKRDMNVRFESSDLIEWNCASVITNITSILALNFTTRVTICWINETVRVPIFNFLKLWKKICILCVNIYIESNIKVRWCHQNMFPFPAFEKLRRIIFETAEVNTVQIGKVFNQNEWPDYYSFNNHFVLVRGPTLSSYREQKSTPKNLRKYFLDGYHSVIFSSITLLETSQYCHSMVF